MILKVTLSEGMGRVRCPFPAFELNEEKCKSIFVHERTDQLKQLEDEGIVSIETVTEAEYDKALARVSKALTIKAIKQKRAGLNRLIKTGGKEKVITGSGMTLEIEPGDISPEEVSKEAQKELDALNAQVGDEHPPDVPNAEEPVESADEFGDYLKDTGV